MNLIIQEAESIPVQPPGHQKLMKLFIAGISSKNIFPMGPQLVEKARQIAEQLGKNSFKGSNKWLEKWKKRYNLKQLKISGESGDVHGKTVDSWKERLPEIIDGYAKDNIWNMDETGVFFTALPDRGFGAKGRKDK